MFKDKTILITGGTESFGNAVLRCFLDSEVKGNRIFSLDKKNKMTCAINCKGSI